MKITILLLLGAAALFLLDRLGLYLESRGWIYYRKTKASPASLGNALLELQSILEPGKRNVVEVRTEEVVEGDEEGDPPPPDWLPRRRQRPEPPSGEAS
ncbi:MAG TPA: hypothetical protein VJ725_05355 [Thermoanaerobaculia bacterium]|nr:hypothetical protein [Thermoanaerobaculia bacterium]